MDNSIVKIRAVIVDDEAVAREKLSRMLSREEDVEVVAVCKNGTEVLARIADLKPDVLFLDIEMPVDGFTVLERLRMTPMPFTIFTTAYDQYAVKAFENRALDYLLKPFSRQRLQESMQRAREHLGLRNSGKLAMQMASYLENHNGAEKYLDRLVFKADGRYVFLSTKDIRWIAAEENYLRICTDSATYLLRGTMTRISAKLDPAVFLRIHRSTLVNVAFIKELQPWFNRGESAVILHDGTRLTVSRGFRSRIDELITK